MSRYPYLFAELVKDDSWSEEDLKKLAGLNFLRVFRTVEQVGKSVMSIQICRVESDISLAFNICFKQVKCAGLWYC